jgi:hypothetical protein
MNIFIVSATQVLEIIPADTDAGARIIAKWDTKLKFVVMDW